METTATLGIIAKESRVRDFLALLKPRVMSLVVFTGFCGVLLAPGHIHPFIGCIAVLCIALGSGASGAINMWYDRDIDAHMQRTCTRPIPTGNITPYDALGFGVTVALGSVILMALAVNTVSALLLASAILFYVFIYTIWLKRRTPQNIVIGGAAGAFPPVIGWAAVTGHVGIESLVLFAIIFMWTPPHFWALSLYRHDDYARVGVPMLPVVAGNFVTRKYILAYTIALFVTTLLPNMMGMSGWIYGIGAAGLGAQFLAYAIKLYRHYNEALAKKMFGFSILYLFLIFICLVVDHLIYPYIS